MKHLVCALILAATTAIDLEYLWTDCPAPKFAFYATRMYDGKTNYKVNHNTGNDFTIVFDIKSIETPGIGTGHWWNGSGIVDAEVPGLRNDFGVSLMQGNKIAFGTGSPQGDSTLFSSRSVKANDTVAVTRRLDGYMAIYINGSKDNEHYYGSKNYLNASPQVTVGSINNNTNFFKGKLSNVKMYDYSLEDCIGK